MRRPWSDADTRQLRWMAKEGFSLRGISIWLRHPAVEVYRHAQRMGLELGPCRRPFTAEDDQVIRRTYPRFPAFLVAHVLGRSASSVSQRARTLGVQKAPDYWAQPNARLWNSTEHPNCIAARIKPGNVPANKGLRRPGWSSGRMATTQFKKGRPAQLAHNYVPIGTEKIDPKRGLVRKITDDPAIFPINRWQPVSRLVWEAAHGPVPAGHVVRFRDGMKTFNSEEITIDRLELVSLAQNMRRNSLYNYPPEIVSAIKTRAVLTRVINRKRKKQ